MTFQSIRNENEQSLLNMAAIIEPTARHLKGFLDILKFSQGVATFLASQNYKPTGIPSIEGKNNLITQSVLGSDTDQAIGNIFNHL